MRCFRTGALPENIQSRSSEKLVMDHAGECGDLGRVARNLEWRMRTRLVRPQSNADPRKTYARLLRRNARFLRPRFPHGTQSKCANLPFSWFSTLVWMRYNSNTTCVLKLAKQTNDEQTRHCRAEKRGVFGFRRITWGGNDDYGYRLGCCSARVGIDSLAQPYLLHHLHDHDRQPAIWLDAIRQSDQQGARLVDRIDSGGLRRLHRS